MKSKVIYIFIGFLVGASLISIGYSISLSKGIGVTSEVKESTTNSIETICPDPIEIVEECLPCVCVNSSETSTEDLDKLINMNKRLGERLKTQYEKDPQTRGWARLCLPDEYECLLK